MKRFIRLPLCVVLLASLLLGTKVTAAAFPGPAPDIGYSIASYDVNVVISADGTYSVTETICANFAKPLAVIVRDIPEERYFYLTHREKSGGAIPVRASYKVSDVTVEGCKFELASYEDGHPFLEGNVVGVRMGDPNTALTGSRTYKLTYKLKPGKWEWLSSEEEQKNKFDLAYYNIMDGSWLVAVGQMTFSVTMPKNIDKSKLRFTVGGNINSNINILLKIDGHLRYDESKTFEYAVNGRTITGRMLRPLEPVEALTMYLDLSSGYFSDAADETTSSKPAGTEQQSMIILVIVGGGLGILIIMGIVFVRSRRRRSGFQ